MPPERLANLIIAVLLIVLLVLFILYLADRVSV